MEFRSIPEFPNYEINAEGVVKNKTTGNIIKPWGKKDCGLSITMRRYEDGVLKKRNRQINKLISEIFPSADIPSPKVKRGGGQKRRVGKYSVKTGKLCCEYDSVQEASKMTKYSMREIISACQNPSEKTGMYTWAYLDTDFTMSEIRDWETVEGYPSYKISEEGVICRASNGKRINPQRGSFLTVKLKKDDVVRSEKVHILMADTYLSRPKKGEKYVIHINGDNYDNRIENLKWSKEDLDERKSVVTPKKGKEVVKLSIEDKEISRYESISDASKASGLSSQSISKVCHGRGKTAGGFKWKFA